MRALALALLLTLLPFRAQAAEATAGLIAELVGIEQEIRDTRWTWDNRDQKKALEEKAKLVKTILGAIADYEARVCGCGPTYVQGSGATRSVVHVPRSISDTEVELIARIVRIDDQVERGDWGFSNRDEEKALVQEKKRATETLQAIAAGLCR